MTEPAEPAERADATRRPAMPGGIRGAALTVGQILPWLRPLQLLESNMFRQIGLTLATRILMILSGVVTAILTARLLGPAGRAEYFYVITLAMLASQFGNLGLPATTMRVAAEDPGKMASLAANTFWVSLFMGIAMSAGFMAFEEIAGGVGFTLMCVLFIMVPSMLYGVLGSNLLLGLLRTRWFNLWLLASTAIQLVAIVAAALLTRNMYAILWANALAMMVGSAGLWLGLRRLGADAWRFDWQLLRSGIAYSGRVYLITLIGLLVSRLNVILIERLSTREELGIYSVAVQFTDALLLIPGTVSLVVFPNLVKSIKSDAFAKTVRTAAVTTAIMGLLCLVTALLAEWIIPLMFGAEFAGAARVLLYLLPGTFALSVAMIFSQFLSARGVPIPNVVVWIVACVSLVVAGFALIPAAGAAGAALALSSCYVLLSAGIMLIAIGRRRVHLET